MQTKIYYSKLNAIFTFILTAGLLVAGLRKVIKDDIIEGYASEIIIFTLIGLALLLLIYKSIRNILHSKPVMIFDKKGLIIKNELFDWSIISSIDIAKGFMARIAIHYYQKNKKKTITFRLDELKISRKTFMDRLSKYYN